MPRILATILILFLLWNTAWAQNVSATLQNPSQVPGSQTVPANTASPVSNQTPSSQAVTTSTTESGSSILSSSIFKGLMSIAGKFLSFTVFAINYIIGFIGGVLFALGGLLLQLALELNARIILNPIVQVGWVIARDFANLGFVVAILAIAFATMLRLETYGTKKMLANLIIVALLVNFSLTIAGVFIDGTNLISNFFIKQITPSGTGGLVEFSENLASVFQLQKLQEVADITQMPEFNSLQEFSASTLGLIASIFFVALFTIIGAIVMLMIAGLMLVRYVALSILLIIMPLALITFLFPSLKDNWGKWFSKFTDWLVFLPITLFFLYLTILAVTNFRTNPNSFYLVSQSVDLANANFITRNFLMPIAGGFQIFGQMIVVLVLLIGSLVVAKSFSLDFSKGIIQLAESAKDRVLQRAKGAAIAPGRALGRKLLSSKTASGVARGLSRIPGLKFAGSALANRIAASKQTSREEVNNYRRRHYANLPKASDVYAYSRTLGQKMPGVIAEAAAAAELAERGKIDEVLAGLSPRRREQTINSWLQSAQEAGVAEDILKVKPDWAEKIGGDTAKTVAKINPKDIVKVSPESLSNLKVLSSLNSNQIQELSKNASAEIKKKIKEAVEKELDRQINQLRKISKANLKHFVRLTEKEVEQLAKKQGKTQAEVLKDIQTLKSNLQANLGLNDEEVKQLETLATFDKIINNNPTWQI